MPKRGRELLIESLGDVASGESRDADDIETRSPVDFDPDTVDIADGDVLDRLEPSVREWWVDEFGRYVGQNGGFFTPPQREAIPLVDEGENALVCAPTGSGKTLASFTAILNDLFRRSSERENGLENAVYCLYVSPLKSLANDIHRNLTVPLEGIEARMRQRGEAVEVRHAIRHGDTDSTARQRMLEETPHILNTTPETLAILLNAPKFREKLRSVAYVVVDEIHSLAESKRGTHLAVSLERLEDLVDASPTRIGCSATVEPLSTMAEFLVGREGSSEPWGSRTEPGDCDDGGGPRDCDDGGGPRDCEIVDTRFVRDFDLRLECPTDDLIHTPREAVQDGFYDRLDELVRSHRNTLVFTNTRSGAERVLENLRERFDGYDESNTGCHHGSLSKERRKAVEEGLKSGSLDVVTTSTSLELGIDMPHLDLVVQVGSPKSVASLLQRVGRAGHSLGQTVEGRVIALDRDELVECAVMLQKAESGFVDRVFVPENAHDVAAQHVYGMAINGVRREADVLRTLRRAYPYRNYGDDDWETLLRYLTADYEGLEERNVYAKVWRDENDPPSGEHHHGDFEVGEPLLGKRGRLARVIYLTNVGTIPDSFTCEVYTRGDDEWVGTLDEGYLDTLEKGDVFVLGGQRFAYRYRRGSKVYVDPTTQRATVPSWFSERLPLSYDLGREIADFQGDLLDRLDAGGRPAVREWLREFPIGENAVRAITRLFDEQRRFAGTESVATDERIVVEEELDRETYRRHFYVHSTYGRRFNDGLSRLVAARCADRSNANVQIAVADNGFSLSMPLNRKVDVAAVVRDLDPDSVRGELRDALSETDLLKRYFRIDATRALMILKRYKGYEKSAAEQQVSAEMLLSFAEDLEGFAVIEETYRELIEDKLNLGALERILSAVHGGAIDVVSVSVESPTPRAFGLATLLASDVVLAEDESAALRDFHERVLAEINGEGWTGPGEVDREGERSLGGE
ncbi:ATP-dependent helicase [Halobellus sp. GM3]|uniref:ATP-dependent helicase n=1 Tax=Halobellus sp. GM3 TaxID=3458410 RepID=UPI00403E042A